MKDRRLLPIPLELSEENLEIQVKDLIESVEVSKFESGVDNKSVNERVDNSLKRVSLNLREN